MRKRKVQVIICIKEFDAPYFLTLQMNVVRNSFWQNITGGVEQDETLKEAAVREAIEETALEVNNIEKITVMNMNFSFIDQWNNEVEEYVFFFKCKKKWPVKLDPKEHQSFRWISKDQITRDCVHFESNYIALQEALKLL